MYVNPLPSYINNVIQNPVDVPQAVAIPQMVKNTPEYHNLGTIVESKKLNDKSFVPEKEVRLNSSGYIEPPSNSMSALINNDKAYWNEEDDTFWDMLLESQRRNEESQRQREESDRSLLPVRYPNENNIQYHPTDETLILGVSGKWVKNNKQNVQKLLEKNKKD